MFNFIMNCTFCKIVITCIIGLLFGWFVNFVLVKTLGVNKAENIIKEADEVIGKIVEIKVDQITNNPQLGAEAAKITEDILNSIEEKLNEDKKIEDKSKTNGTTSN